MGVPSGRTIHLRPCAAWLLVGILAGFVGCAPAAEDSAAPAATPAAVAAAPAAPEAGAAAETDDQAAAKADEPKGADEKKDADKSKAEKKSEAEEQVPPPPTPTPEEIAKRQKRTEQYKTLGEKFFKFPVTGSLTSKYVLRVGDDEGSHNRAATWTRGRSTWSAQALPPLGRTDQHQYFNDQDLYEYLTMDFGDPTRHMVTGHFDLRVDADLNGYHDKVDQLVIGRRRALPAGVATYLPVDRRDEFLSIDDTFHSAVNAYCYSAYADFNKIPGVSLLRVGRQYTYETPEVTRFDGLRLDTKPFFGDKELVFSFYGGQQTHDYEQQGSASFPEDMTYGAAAEGRPWDGGRMRMDWQHFRDDLAGIWSWSEASHTVNNDVVSLSVWHEFRRPDVRVQGSVSVLDGSLRDAFARVMYNKPDWRFFVAATYTGWFSHPGVRALELNPYLDVLGPQSTYHQGDLRLNKEWLDCLSTEFGVTVRRFDYGDKAVREQAITELYNRDYDRYYVTLDAHNLPVKGLSASVTGSFWNGRGRGSRTTQASGDISYDWSKELQTSIGTDFALYRYFMPFEKFGATAGDFWEYDVEREHVRTYYIKQRWRPTRWAQLEARYELEQSRTNKFHTLMATFRFTF